MDIIISKLVLSYLNDIESNLPFLSIKITRRACTYLHHSAGFIFYISPS